MSLESRISDAIQDWCGQAPADFTITLEDLWILTNSLPFDPDGMELLIQALEREFQNPPGLQVTLSPPDFRAGGKVKTVQNLIDEAAAFPDQESDVIPRTAARAKKAASAKTVARAVSRKSVPNLPIKKATAKRAARKKIAPKKKATARKPAAKKARRGKR